MAENLWENPRDVAAKAGGSTKIVERKLGGLGGNKTEAGEGTNSIRIKNGEGEHHVVTGAVKNDPVSIADMAREESSEESEENPAIKR